MNWSVPASINAQSSIDDVLWINCSEADMPHFHEVECFHKLSEYGSLSLANIQHPFDKPDVVVFEGLYFKEYIAFAKELRKSHIPYIIVPRGSMTYQAMHNHAWLKKWIAHKLYFNKFIKYAWKIQFLTKQESLDSSNFKKAYFIVPNGINPPQTYKQSFSSTSIKAIFIGRIDIYHKGLDLLLNAFVGIEEILKLAKFSLNIYGPQRYDYYKVKEFIENNNLSEIVILNDEIEGDEKKNALLASDLFIMTSRFEGHPMGLIEALSYGLPCLVTTGTNMADEIIRHNAGWGVNISEKDIQNALLKIIKNKSSYFEKGNNARKLSQFYNWKDLAISFHKEILLSK